MNYSAVAEIAARLTKQPADRSAGYSPRATIIAIHLLLDLDVLQRNVDITKALGFINASVNVRGASDLSLVEEAAKRLK